jgi:hypothetical protein
MGLQQFVVELSALHEKAKKGQLSPSERMEYERDRDELATALVNAQRIALKPGEMPRRALRVGRVLSLEITAGTVITKTITLEVSSGGFSVNTSTIPAAWNNPVSFRLKLPDGREIKGTAQLVNSQQQPTHTRVGFSITQIPDEEREALTRVVFDDVLGKLGGGRRP